MYYGRDQLEQELYQVELLSDYVSGCMDAIILLLICLYCITNLKLI